MFGVKTEIANVLCRA